MVSAAKVFQHFGCTLILVRDFILFFLIDLVNVFLKTVKKNLFPMLQLVFYSTSSYFVLMKHDQYSVLEIRILLKCDEQPLSKRRISQLYSKFKKVERDTALAHLVDEGLLVSKVMPKPGTRKNPTFYFLTEKGVRWVKNYQASFPQ